MRLLLVSVLLAFTPPAASGATIEAPVNEAQPASPRVLAEQFLADMNAAGSSRSFIETSFSQAALSREPAADRARQFDRLKALAGGFQALDWRPQGERMIELVAVSRRGNRHAKFVIFTSSKEPGKIADIIVIPERDPARAAADEFPNAAVSNHQLVQLVERRIDALANEGSFSGAVLVALDDQVLVREARGMADEVWHVPNRPDTRFNVASVSKMWTAVIIMKLVEQGKLSLDDTLGKWVAAYPHQQAASKITIRQLLQHRAGLGDWDVRQTRSPLTSSAAAATMTEEPGEPDKNFAYSNAGYVLLGAAAEKATGLTYEQLVDQFVFRPAGMKSSGFWPVTAIVSNRATGYLRPADDPLGFGPKFSNEQFLGYAGNASGGAYSTVDDLFAFHRALATGHLLRPETVKLMVDSSVEFSGAPRPMRYGLGLRLESCAGVPTLGHGGGGANSGVSSATYATLDGRWTIVVLGNTDPMPEQVAIDVCELVHRS